MQLQHLIDGLSLVAKYDGPDGDFDCHDGCIFAGDPEKFSKEDRTQMQEMGWAEDEEAFCAWL